jgi:hypothetical protein
VSYSPLDVRNRLACIGFVPAPIKILGRGPKLDNQVAGQVLWLDLAALFPPKPEQRVFALPMIMRASDPPTKNRRSTRAALSNILRPSRKFEIDRYV